MFLKKIILFMLIIGACCLNCSDEQKDPIKFSVRSTEGNFTGGWYKVDGGTTYTFSGSAIGSGVYEYEKKIKELDYLEVGACKNTVDQSIEIKIYRDKVKVKSDKVEPEEELSSGDYKYCLELDYEYGEEESSTTEE